MDRLRHQSPEAIKQKRRQQLVESLAEMRIPELSDVILVCGEREFFVHKAILQASGCYFKAMFTSKMVEAESRRVQFQNMEPETLSDVLDFIYLGSVEHIKTGAQFHNLLVASDFLRLVDLFHYCWAKLLSQISVDNFFDLLFLSLKYKTINKKELLYFWNHHSEMLVPSTEFQNLSHDQVSELLCFLKNRLFSLDSLLLGLPNWIQHNEKRNQEFVFDILDCIDVKLVSKDCAKVLLKELQLINLPREVRSKFNDICVPILIADDLAHPIDLTQLQDPITFCKTKIMFFGNRCYVSFFNVELALTFKENNSVSKNCIQQFDIENMTWLPLQSFNYNCSRAAMCQYENCIYVIGGDYNLGLVYNVESNYVTQLECDKINERKNAGLCYFKSYLYLIGGSYEDETSNRVSTSSVYFTKPGLGSWREASPCEVNDNVYGRILALTSSQYLYVVVDCKFPSDTCIVRYNSCPEKGQQWETIYFYSEQSQLNGKNFFVYKDKLHALYLTRENTVLASYDHQTKQVTARRFSPCPEDVLIHNIFATDHHATVWIVTDKESVCPNVRWDPETGMWVWLLLTQGEVKIPSNFISNTISYTW